MDKENVVYTVNGILFGLFFKRESLPFASIWMNLEAIMLKEIIQSQKDRYVMISLT